MDGIFVGVTVLKYIILFFVLWFSINYCSVNYQFKMRLYECDKEEIRNDFKLMELISTLSNNTIICSDNTLRYKLFTGFLSRGYINLKVYKDINIVKVEINSRNKNSFETFIEDITFLLKPNFYTFTDPFSTN